MYNYVWIYKYLHIHACEHCIYIYIYIICIWRLLPKAWANSIYIYTHTCLWTRYIYNMYMAFASKSMSKQYIYIIIYIYTHTVCSILRFAHPCNSIWRWLKIKCPCFSLKFRGSKSRHLLLKDIHLHFLFVSILSSS